MALPEAFPHSFNAVRAQAKLHHAYFLGLQLAVVMEHGADVTYDWMFRLFRRQHKDKFLSSFEKLGLTGLPHAVACAQYHVLSNNVGGVGVEYAFESDQKAWVRFRYPRWMYAGPTICGIPREVSLGFLKGWYAENGVSLKNPRLGFVCVSEDMTGQFGLCGYFKEFDAPLAEDQRLQFAPDETPPRFEDHEQPSVPQDAWNEARLEKANRNYAVEYVRNGLIELAGVVGEQAALAIGCRVARLIGLQYFAETRALIGGVDGGVADASRYLAQMLEGMGDEVRILSAEEGIVHQLNQRILSGLPQDNARLVWLCWQELWVGAMRSQSVMKSLSVIESDQGTEWRIELT